MAVLDGFGEDELGTKRYTILEYRERGYSGLLTGELEPEVRLPDYKDTTRQIPPALHKLTVNSPK